MGKKKERKKKEYAIYVGSCIFYSERSVGCKFLVRSMFLQALVFPRI